MQALLASYNIIFQTLIFLMRLPYFSKVIQTDGPTSFHILLHHSYFLNTIMFPFTVLSFSKFYVLLTFILSSSFKTTSCSLYKQFVTSKLCSTINLNKIAAENQHEILDSFYLLSYFSAVRYHWYNRNQKQNTRLMDTL